MQLGRKLRPGSAGSNDRHMELPGTHGLGLAVGPQARVDDPAVQAAGLLGRLEGMAYFAAPSVPKSLVTLPIAMISVT